MHHMNIEGTLFLTWKLDANVFREIGQSCNRFQAAKPTPSVHEVGKIWAENYKRLVMEMKHYW